MMLSQLRRAVRARPFRPFSIHLADGRELQVVHPEVVALDPRGEVAAVLIPAEGFEIIELSLVTGLTRPRRRRQ